MLTLRDSSHINTMDNIKGFRSCATSTGVPMAHLEYRRFYRADLALAVRRVRREWLARLWSEHRERCRRAGQR